MEPCALVHGGNPNCARVAQVRKYEQMETYDDEGISHTHKVEYHICRSCNDYFYDGTEEYPEVKPL